MNTHGNKRRDFLKQLFGAFTVICGGFILWAAKNYFSFHPDSNRTEIGKFSQLIKSQIVHKKKERLYIIRDSVGLYAVSDVCTHRGCMLRIKNNRFECPCHSAVFTLEGKPVSGPANKPLDHYYIYKNKQNILVVDATQIVNKDFHYSE